MIKKITLIIILCCLIFSCGKKGDPKYQSSLYKPKIPSIILIKI